MAEAPPDWRKMLRPFLGRAKEMKQAEPCVSYYCLKYAAEKAMELYKATGDPECRAEVSRLLDACQSSTVDMTDVEGRAHCEEFAIRLFGNLDSAEKEGLATKRMAGQFLVASTFFEILRQFDPDGELDAKMQEMQTYACWKAGQIAKAVKQGQIPPPGPKGWVPPPDAAPAEEMNLPGSSFGDIEGHPLHGYTPGNDANAAAALVAPPAPPDTAPPPAPPAGMPPLGFPSLPEGFPSAPATSPGPPPPPEMPPMQPTTSPGAPQIFPQAMAPPTANYQPMAPAAHPTEAVARPGATSLGYTWEELREIVDLQKQAIAAHRVLAKGYEDVPEAKKLLKELVPKLRRLAAVQASLNNQGNRSA